MYEAYKSAAAELGLRMNPVEPGMMTFFIDLDGTVDGRQVHVRRVVGANGFFVVESTWETPLGAGLAVSSAGLFDTLASLVGFHDLEVGDAAFDHKFRVKAKDAARAKTILHAEVREALLQLGPHVKLTDRSLSARYDHHAESSELVVRTCRDVARVAGLVTT